jgi:Flp pilus assembly protein TadD
MHHFFSFFLFFFFLACVTPSGYIENDLQLAKNYARDGLYRDSLGIYRKILMNNPNHSLAHKDLGALFLQLERFKAAKFHLKKSLDLIKDDDEIYFF